MMKEKVVQCLAETLEKDVKQLDEEMVLADFFEWDSLASIFFASLIQEKTGKKLSVSDIWHCEYVYELVDLVEEK